MTVNRSNWFSEFRLAWIKESVGIYGFINREHIARKFGLSIPQCAVDLREVQAKWPKLMTYNPTTKRYERNGD